MTETGLGGGVQCSAQLGYHLREADLFFEIVDTETGQPLKEGETGEIVFTTLTRTGMPLIRYRTGDLSRFIPENCPCGTKLRSMEVVKQRIDGKVKLDGTDFSIHELDEVLFSLDGVLDYRVRIEHTDNKNFLYIEIKTAEETGVDHELVHHVLNAIREGVVMQTLQVILSEPSENFAVSKGASKRRIADNRKNNRILK